MLVIPGGTGYPVSTMRSRTIERTRLGGSQSSREATSLFFTRSTNHPTLLYIGIPYYANSPFSFTLENAKGGGGLRLLVLPVPAVPGHTAAPAIHMNFVARMRGNKLEFIIVITRGLRA